MSNNKIVFVGDLVEQNNEPWWVNNVKKGHQYVLGQRVRINLECSDEPDLDMPEHRVFSLTWDCDGTPLYCLLSTELDSHPNGLETLKRLAFQNQGVNGNGLVVAIFDILVEKGLEESSKRIEPGKRMTMDDFLYIYKAIAPYMKSNYPVESLNPVTDERLNMLPPFTPVHYLGERYLTTTYRLLYSGEHGVVYDLVEDPGRPLTRHEFFGQDDSVLTRIERVHMSELTLAK